MGLLDGLLGNASEINSASADNEVSALLTDGEVVEKVYRVVRDLFVFTDKRLILLDKQGLTGKKIHYESLPYRHISHFSVELAGHLDLDSELYIWITGYPTPLMKKFRSSTDILAVQKTLANHVLKA